MPIQKPRLHISEYRERRRAWDKSHDRRFKVLALSLTSLVDVFAILVLYLIMNQAMISEWIEVGHGILLPIGKAAMEPPKAPTIQIAADFLYIGEKKIGATSEVMKQEGVLNTIRIWLAQQTKKDGHVNVVGHGKIAFGIVRRVVKTCQAAGFRKVNLVIQPGSKTI